MAIPSFSVDPAAFSRLGRRGEGHQLSFTKIFKVVAVLWFDDLRAPAVFSLPVWGLPFCFIVAFSQSPQHCADEQHNFVQFHGRHFASSRRQVVEESHRF